MPRPELGEDAHRALLVLRLWGLVLAGLSLRFPGWYLTSWWSWQRTSVQLGLGWGNRLDWRSTTIATAGVLAGLALFGSKRLGVMACLVTLVLVLVLGVEHAWDRDGADAGVGSLALAAAVLLPPVLGGRALWKHLD